MRPELMTDFEIRRELLTATGDRRKALLAEIEDRKKYRTWKPDQGFPPIGHARAGKNL